MKSLDKKFFSPSTYIFDDLDKPLTDKYFQKLLHSTEDDLDFNKVPALKSFYPKTYVIL